jgi:hypothetical protein
MVEFWFLMMMSLLLVGILVQLGKQEIWRGLWVQKVRVPVRKQRIAPVHPRSVRLFLPHPTNFELRTLKFESRPGINWGEARGRPPTR